MKQIISNYTFNKTAKTVTFSDFTSLDLRRVMIITNVTANTVIYLFNDPTLGGSASGNVLTLTYNTTAMNNADKLQIIYDKAPTDPNDESKAQYSRAIGVMAGPSYGSSTSEAGIGAIMPWANDLYFTNYTAENGEGSGLGLWRLRRGSSTPELINENNCCDAGRIISGSKLVMGRFIIDTTGSVTNITGFPGDARITGYCVSSSTNTVYALTMGGSLYSVNLTTAAASFVSDAAAGLSLTGFKHGKSIWMHPDKDHIFVAFNMLSPDGRLGIYSIAGNTWTNVDSGNNSWVEVAGSYDGNQYSFASGHDNKSGLLWMFDGPSFNATPRKFRLPLAHWQQMYGWQQEWMRIRAVDTERYLFDQHGMFYELSSFIQFATGGSFSTAYPRIEPIARHIRTVPDFCYWNGNLVLAGNQVSPQTNSKYPNSGQPQSGLLFIHQDELWSWGKPNGIGFWYRNEPVLAAATSDAMLARGFENKSMHFVNDDSTDVIVQIFVSTRALAAKLYNTVTVPKNSYVDFPFPQGFHTEWVSIKVTSDRTNFSAWVHYE